MMLTHDPYQPTPGSADWDPKAAGEAVNVHPRHFGEMVAYMDKLIGKLVAKLDDLEIRDRTLLLFLGDNGTGRRATSRMGERTVQGGKGTTTERGMHVPLIASWPGVIAAGQVRDEIVDTTDFLPTLLEAAGVPPPAGLELDGRSFLPFLRGEPGAPREWIYSWYSPRQLPRGASAVREFVFDHRYKLYRTGELYDLGKDAEETQPLAVDRLEGEAAAAARKLGKALERFRGARPAELDRAFEEAAR
jgi:arylsulfatase A